VLDFEDIPGMIVSNGNPIPQESRLSDQYLTTFGVRFYSGSPYVGVRQLGAGHATSGVNGIGGSTPDGLLTQSPTNPVFASFWDPQDPDTPATTDLVSLRLDLRATSQASVTLNAYDINGVLVDSFTTPDSAGAVLQVLGQGIHMVEYLGVGDSNSAATDDFTFNPVVPIPEPVAIASFVPVVLALSWGRRIPVPA
jgi:hypothetical protein